MGTDTKPKKQPRKTQIASRYEDEDIKVIDQIAQSQNLTRTEVQRELVRKSLSKQDTES